MLLKIKVVSIQMWRSCVCSLDKQEYHAGELMKLRLRFDPGFGIKPKVSHFSLQVSLLSVLSCCLCYLHEARWLWLDVWNLSFCLFVCLWISSLSKEMLGIDVPEILRMEFVLECVPITYSTFWVVPIIESSVPIFDFVHMSYYGVCRVVEKWKLQ